MHDALDSLSCILDDVSGTRKKPNLYKAGIGPYRSAIPLLTEDLPRAQELYKRVIMTGWARQPMGARRVAKLDCFYCGALFRAFLVGNVGIQ